MAAVLTPAEVVLVQVEQRVVVGRVPLPVPGAAIFAAPDGSALVPLEDADATVQVYLDGRMRRQAGRVFPLFFDEFDRMFVVAPEQLVLLAYPQRVRIGQVPLPGVREARHAAASGNGLAVAVVSAAPATGRVWLVSLGGEVQVVPVTVPCAVERVALARDAGWLAAACGEGRLLVFGVGAGEPHRVSLGGEITALLVDDNHRDLLVGVASAGGGALVRLAVQPGKSRGVKERTRTNLPRPPRALAASGSTVLVLDERGLGVWEKGGRSWVGEVPVVGGSGVVVLRRVAGLPAEGWGEPNGGANGGGGESPGGAAGPHPPA